MSVQQVHTTDIANGAITSAKIADGSIVTADLADGSVTTAKVVDGAVTSAKIADGSIVTTDLADGAVTSQKIADGSIATNDIADSAVTSIKIADGSLVTADYANASVTNAKLASDVGRLNQLVNGGFEMWQRGTVFNTNSVYGPDRWLLTFTLGTSGSGCNVVQETSVLATGSQFAASCAFNPGTGGTPAYQLTQKLEALYQLRGRTLSLSAQIYQDVANAWIVRITKGGGAAGTQYSTGTLQTASINAWTTLSSTLAVAADATLVQVEIVWQGPASSTTRFDNVSLVVGAQPCDYIPMHPADEIARCQRYYEFIGVPGSGDTIVRGPGYSTGTYYDTVTRFRVIKPVTPTVTKVGTWNAYNMTQPNAQSTSVEGFRLEASVTAVANDTYTYNINAGNTLTVEANP